MGKLQWASASGRGRYRTEHSAVLSSEHHGVDQEARTPEPCAAVRKRRGQRNIWISRTTRKTPVGVCVCVCVSRLCSESQGQGQLHEVTGGWWLVSRLWELEGKRVGAAAQTGSRHFGGLSLHILRRKRNSYFRCFEQLTHVSSLFTDKADIFIEYMKVKISIRRTCFNVHMLYVNEVIFHRNYILMH